MFACGGKHSTTFLQSPSILYGRCTDNECGCNSICIESGFVPVPDPIVRALHSVRVRVQVGGEKYGPVEVRSVDVTGFDNV